MTAQRRKWHSEKERDLVRSMDDSRRAWLDEHTAKHGEHTCTPDPTDPWSTCRLIKAGEAS